MCGIIAVVRRPSSQTPPGARGVLAKMEEARALAAQVTGDWVATAAALDRLAAPTAGDALAGPDPSGAAVAAFASIEATLAALDRIEVRGRDSAGVHVLVTGHGLDLNDLGIAAELAARADPLFTNGATRTPRGHLAFVYKAASEVGELGDNGRRLRAAIAADELLHRAVAAAGAEALVLGHTRWASVGL